jgi:flagellar motility protein MotE (MotC chaperone)
MDIETAQKILMNMKGEQAGLILSYVNSDHAARISRSLALKKPRKDTT